jgi:Outer membrane protein and related peptidoglycan-associated (lipo)proteins
MRMDERMRERDMNTQRLEPLWVLRRLLFAVVLCFGMALGMTAAQAAGIISGTVFNDVNNNTTFNTGIDYGVSGVVVALQNSSGTEITTVTTGAGGTFTFPSQAAGSYRIQVKTAPTGYAAQSATATTVMASGTTDTPNSHLGLRGTGGSIAGRVFNDLNRNLAYDDGTATNLTGVNVYLKQGTTILSTVQTDGSGYVFRNLPSGVAFTVEVEEASLVATMLVGHTDSTVDSPKKVFSVASVTSALTGKSFATTEQVSGVGGLGIDGIVAVEIDGIVGYTPGADLLLSGAKVELFYNDGTTPVPGVAEFTTGADGKYEFFNLPMWKYRIKMTPPTNFTASGNVSPVSNDVIGIDLNSVNPVGAQNFYATGVNGVTGAVFGYASGGFSSNFGPDGGGTQVQGPSSSTTAFGNITVELHQGSTLLLTQKTKSDGTYSFRGIPTGTYTVKISKADTDSQRPDYGFMNDSDGKSSYRSKAPYEISDLVVTASGLRSGWNFWFSRKGSMITRISPSLTVYNNTNTWSTPVHGVNVLGYTPKVDLKLYEQDGQTPAKDVNGVELPTVSTTFWGGSRERVAFSSVIADVIPNVYIVKPSGYHPSLTIRPNVTGLTDGWRIVSSADLSLGTSQGHFDSANEVSGRIYVDNGTPLHKAIIRLETMNSTGTAVDTDYAGMNFGADENGEYKLTNLQNGYYRIRVTALPSEYASQITFKTDYDEPTAGTTASFIVHVTGSTKITTGDIVYQSNNTSFYINGTVWQDLVQLGSLDKIEIDNRQKGYYDLELDGITLTLTNNVDSTTQTYTTDHTGKFNFTGLSGNRTYTVTASGNSVKFINFGEGTNTRTVTFGATPGLMKYQDFLVQGYGNITVNGFMDVTGNGLRDASGDFSHNNQMFRLYKKIGGVYVDLRPDRFYDINAEFDLLSFPPGDYRISSISTAESYIADTSTDGNNPDGSIGTIDFTIPSGTTPTTFNNARMIYGRGAWDVSGSIYTDINDNGILDAADRVVTNLSGVGIRIFETPRFLNDFTTAGQRTYNANHPEYTGTLASGVYTIGGIRSGNLLINVNEADLGTKGYTVINNAPNAVPHGTNATLPANLKEKSTIQVGFQTGNQTNQSFLVNRSITAKISGKVFQDVMYNTAFDSGEDVAITGQTIQLYQGTSATGTPYATLTVDANGDYSFNNLPDGTYTVRLVPGNIPASLELVEAGDSQAFNRTVTINVGNSNNSFTQNFWFNKLGEAGIAGSVLVDVDGSGTPSLMTDSPLSGVNVTATPNGGGTTVTTTTNARGLYKISGLEIGKTYVVTVSGLPSGYNIFKTAGVSPTNTVTIASATIHPDRYFLVAGNSNPNPGVTPNNGGISGYLYVGASATPAMPRLANVTVEISDSSGMISGSVETDANGQYNFYNLSVGPNYTIKVTGATPGYAVRGDVDGVPYGQITTGATVGATKTNQNIWYAAVSTAGITGKVVYSPTHSTTASATDIPLSGMTVELYDSANIAGGVLYSMTTNATGDYSFPGIATMEYVMKVNDAEKTAKGYIDLTPSSGQFTINLVAAGSTGNLFILGGQHELSGLIWRDSNGDGHPDLGLYGHQTVLTWAGPDGNFATTADNVVFTTMLIPESIFVGTGATNSGGVYSYPHLPSGNYRVFYDTSPMDSSSLALMVDNGTTVIDNTAPPRTVTIGTTDLTNVNFAYESLGGLKGRVFLDVNGAGAADASHPGLNSVTVNIYDWDTGTSAFKTTPYKTAVITANDGTNDGAYEFIGIPVGRYKVEATAPSGYAVSYVTKGSVTGYIDETLTATNGTDWNIGLKGSVAHAGVLKTRVDSNNDGAYDSSDAGLPNIQVEVKTASGVTPSFTATVTTDASGNFNLVDLPEVNMTFTVLSNMSAYVGAYDSETTGSTTGTFTILMNAAAYAKEAPAFGYRANITGGSRTISGAVVIDTNNSNAYDATDAPMVGAQVRLYLMSGSTEVYAGVATVAAADGTFSFGPTLPSGTYRLKVTHVPENYIVRFPAATTTSGTGLTAVYTMPDVVLTDTDSTTNYLGFIGDTAGGKGRNVEVLTRNDDGNKEYDSALATDTALSGVSVTLSSASTNYTYTLSTVSGSATFTNVPYATDYIVEARPTSAMKMVYTNAGGQQDVSVSSTTAGTLTGFDVKAAVGTDIADKLYFGFLPNTSGTLKITGKAVFDANNNGAADTGEGINGLTLTLYVQSGGGFIPVLPAATSTTAGDGDYVFDNLAAGTYQVRVEGAANQAMVDGYQARFGLASLHVTNNIVITADGVHNFGYIGDTTTGKARNVEVETRYDTNMNLTYDASLTTDYPASGITITMSSVSRGVTVSATTVTGTGKATFTALGDATDWVVTASSFGTLNLVYNTNQNPGAATATISNVEVKAGMVAPFFGFREGTPPSGSARIDGSVRLDNNGNNAYDSGDSLIGDVTLALSYDVGGGSFAPIGAPVTTATGEYSFTNLDAGTTYRVQVIGGIPAAYTVVYSKGVASSNNFTISTPSADWHFGYRGGGANVKTGNVVIETYLTAATSTAYVPGDTPTGGFEVILTGTSTDGNSITGTYISSSSGTISLQNFPFGSYTLSNGSNTGYDLKYSETGLTVSATSPAAAPKWGWAVNASGVYQVTGSVGFDATGDGVRDSAIAGLGLELYIKTGATTYMTTGLTTTTDTTGAFKFENLGNGDYRVFVVSASQPMLDGYKGINHVASAATIGSNNVHESIDVTINNANATPALDMIYAGDDTQANKNRNLTVMVLSDMDDDKMYSASDNGLKDVNVTISSALRGLSISGLVTAANGEVTLSDMPFSSDYRVTASKSGLISVYDSQHNTGSGGSTGILNNFNVTTATGTRAVDNPFFGMKGTLPSGSATLSGIVVNDATGLTANSYDSQDTGLGGVKLSLSYEDPANPGTYIFVETLETVAGGAYSKASLDGSYNYYVKVISGVPNTYGLVFNPAGPTTANDYHLGTPSTNWHFGYLPGSSALTKDLVVYTYNDSDASGTRTPADTGVAGVQIRISGTSTDGNAIDQVYTSNGSGQIVLTKFPQGNYTIESIAANDAQFDFVYSSGANAKTFALAVNATTPVSGEPYFGYLPKLPTGTLSISGTIKYQTESFGTPHATDQPVSGIKVELFYETATPGTYVSTGKVVTTGTNGEYSFTNLGPDPIQNYKVEVSQLPAGYLPSYKVINGGAPLTGANNHEAILSTTSQVWDFAYRGDGNAANTQTLVIRGYYDINADGVWDVGDTASPQADVMIRIVGTANLITGVEIPLNASGMITLTNLPNDTYTITSVDHDAVYGLSTVYNSTAPTGSSAVNFNVTLNAGYTGNPQYFGYYTDVSGNLTIAGRLVIDSDDNGDYTAPSATSLHDIGIDNVMVDLWRTVSGVDYYVDTGLTNTNGDYVFNNLASGRDYKVVPRATDANMVNLVGRFTKVNAPFAVNIAETVSANVSNWHFGYIAVAGQSATLTLQSRLDSNGNNSYDASTAVDAVSINLPITVLGGPIDQSFNTGASGELVLQNIPYGTYAITATPAGGFLTVYNSATVPGSPTGVPANVTATVSSNLTVPFGFVPNVVNPSNTGQISGRVVIDTNNNVQHNAGDLGLANVVLLVEYEAGGAFYPVTAIPPAQLTTNTNGEFTITNLKMGATDNYRVSVVSGVDTTVLTPSFVGPANTVSSAASYTQILASAAAGQDWNFGYKGVPGQSGTVTVETLLDTDLSSDKSNIVTTVDPNLAAIDVTVNSTNPGFTFTYTGTSVGSGPIILQNIPYGTYSIGASDPGADLALSYDPLSNATPISPVNFTTSSIANEVTYGFKVRTDSLSGIRIEGRVVIDSDMTYAGSESGLNASVTVYQRVNGNWLAVYLPAATNANGDYSFINLVSGKEFKVAVTTPPVGMGIKYVSDNGVDTASAIEEIEKVNVTSNQTWHFAYSGNAGFTGRVVFDVDLSGSYKTYHLGIPGVTVKATNTVTGVVSTVLTDSTGGYTFTGLGVGNYDVVVDTSIAVAGYPSLTGYSPSYAGGVTGATTFQVMAAAANPPGDHNFGLRGENGLAGTVITDVDGDHVMDTASPNEQMIPYLNGGKIVVTSPTDTLITWEVPVSTVDGTFSIANLAPGYIYDFQFVPADSSAVVSYIYDGSTLLSATDDHFSPAPFAPLPINGTLSPIWFGIGSNVSWSGRVVYDVDNSRTLNTPDRPIVGATVTLVNTLSGATRTETTGSNGEYTFAGIMPGDWEAIVSGFPGGVSGLVATFEESVQAPLTTGSIAHTIGSTSVANVNFGFAGTSSISGNVYVDQPTFGVYDATDIPLGNLLVSLYDGNGNKISDTRTLANGSYVFNNLTDWDTLGTDYRLVYDIASTGEPFTFSYDASFTALSSTLYYLDVDVIDNSTAVTNPAFGVLSNLTVEGHVFLDVNDNGVMDAGEELVGVDVLLKDSTGTITYGAAQATDTAGRYEFTGVAKGTYLVVVDSPTLPAGLKVSFDYDDAYNASTVATPHEAVVVVGGSVSGIDFGYIYGGKITAKVFMATGAFHNPADPAFPDAKVEVWDRTTNILIKTVLADANGLVSVRNLDITHNYELVTKYGLPDALAGEVLAQSEFVDAAPGHTHTPNGSPITPTSGTVGLTINSAALTAAPDNEIDESTLYFSYRFITYEVSVTKVARKDTARVGEFVPYMVEIHNNGTDPVTGLSLTDYIPAGFKYVNGSARMAMIVGGVASAPVSVDPSGVYPLTFDGSSSGITLNPGDKVRLTYILVVGSGVTQGEYINKAHSITIAGFQNSNVASATVRVVGDPLFDDSLIFGKVFLDVNRNGRQDKDEPGVGGVKLVTARGEIITTDEHGRYHLADVDGGRWERGTNFILKLDTRSLPQGLVTTTENPIVVRLSPGLPSRINFGVEVPAPLAEKLMENHATQKKEEVKQIEEKLQVEERFVVESVHFAFDRDQILPEFESTLDSLSGVLKNHPEWRIRIEGHTDAVGSESYNRELSQRRANAVRTYLLNAGVPASQLVEAVGLGLSEPIADNGNADGRFRNRRVEFKLVR